MGLTAFVVFIVPWALLAVFLTRSPTVLRLGAAAAPWRPIPTRQDLAREQRRETKPHNTQTANGSGPMSGDKHSPINMTGGGSLGTSAEPTEPDDKV